MYACKHVSLVGVWIGWLAFTVLFNPVVLADSYYFALRD